MIGGLGLGLNANVNVNIQLEAEAKAATSVVSDLVVEHSSDINAHLGLSGSDYEVISFKNQVDNDSNYFIKIKSGGEFYHVNILKASANVSGKAGFQGGCGGQTLTSEITADVKTC